MKQKIDKFKENLMKDSMWLDFKKEFGISQDTYYEIINDLNEVADKSLTKEDISIEIDFESKDGFVVTDDLKLVFESVGFSSMKEILNQISKLESGNYYFHINYEEKYKGNFAFTGVITHLICQKLIHCKNRTIEFDFNFEPGDKFIRIYKR